MLSHYYCEHGLAVALETTDNPRGSVAMEACVDITYDAMEKERRKE